MKLEATNRGRARAKGFSLLEVVIAGAIVALLCAGVLTVIVKVDMANRYLHNRTIAYRAAHQTMEIMLADDMDSMLLQNGNTFAITDLTTGPDNGTITITDLNWVGPDQAYQIRLRVPAYGVDLYGVRTRT